MAATRLLEGKGHPLSHPACQMVAVQRLAFVHVNDQHASFAPVSPDPSEASPWARQRGLFEAVRAANPHTLFTNAGDDFEKGKDSDMLRMRKRFTGMLDRNHTKTMRKYSKFQNTDEENEAYELWRENRAREPKRHKAEPQHHRRRCPACDTASW